MPTMVDPRNNTPMMRRFLTICLVSLALPLAARGATPAANYTDMWWNPSESGWGISWVQHAATGQAFVVWYTYDPREPDTSSADAADYKPLWIVMPDGAWTSPTTITGTAYVTNGTPYSQAWNSANYVIQQVGTFAFSFADSSTGTFTYAIRSHKIVPAGDLAQLRSHGQEVIALQACHPRFFASHRYIAYAVPVKVVPRVGRPFTLGGEHLAAGARS